MSATGSVTLTGNNTYTGGTSLNPKDGTIDLSKVPSSPAFKAKEVLDRFRQSRDRALASDTKDSTNPGNRYTSTPLNPFRAVTTDPLSTFSVDVDTASYANLRRILQSGGSVPPEAVRIEEMINYFPYRYEEPQGEHPFSVKVESASCPWEPSHRLVKIALKAKEMDRRKRGSANLVFLIDVSGSMQGEDRLGLVVENLRVLTKALLPDDTVAIVTYAGSEGLALPPTSGADKATILAKLDSLGAGGSTNGGAGITLAYSTAQSRFLKEGINRVILCTDGDFNVGTTSETSLVDLVAAEAKKGVFLTVCGYGSGNLNDSMMEAITNKGNGVYHYIDSAREGRKVFQDELLGTLFTVAKDVKLQIEFNPQHAAQYRLIGYDNRMLAKEDFANDKVDAGDIGAGHRVTALYEVIPVGAPSASSIPLKYQQPPAAEKPAEEKTLNPELLTVKLRYKEPTADVSKPFDIPFVENLKVRPSTDLTFAATVAEFGERLRGHTAVGRTLDQLMEAAESARGDDPHGHRAEFIELMRKSAK
jgi:Ca-activated chloride channel family protein